MMVTTILTFRIHRAGYWHKFQIGFDIYSQTCA